MSVARLFVSGVLVASGLILAAFTLHGYFDPQWQQRQMQAAGTRATEPWTTSTRAVAGSAVVQETGAPRPAPVKASPKPDAGPPPPATEAAGTHAAAAKAKRLAEKKRAEKKKAEEAKAAAEKAKQQQQPTQQATFQWPWNWKE